MEEERGPANGTTAVVEPSAPLPPAPTPAGAERTRDGRLTRLALTVVQLGPVLILALLVLVFAAAEPVFLGERNVRNVLVQSSVIALLALGQLLVIVTRGIDLSVGAVLALSTVTGALVYRDAGSPGFVIVLVIVSTGIVAGLVNGFVYVKGRVPHPFIVTLAMLSVARGLALVLSDGSAIAGMPSVIVEAGSGRIGWFPIPALVVAVVALLLWILTTRLVWGRWIYAVGGDPEAARQVGIPVGKVLISVYALSGFTAGVAAVVTAGRTNSGFPTAGDLAELDAIAAVIIGGASFFGGRGAVVNAVVGALIIGVIRNGLNLLGVNTFTQLIAVGVVVVLAVQMDVLRTSLEGKLRSARARGADV
jgi:ribose transport system permease protein